MDEIASRDPSPTKKYTPWMVKQLVVGANPNDLYPSIAYFHRHIAKFEKKDINAYRTAKDLEDAVKAVDAGTSTLGDKSGTVPAKVIAEDGTVTLEWIEKREDAQRYSKTSHWCITQKSMSHFEEYDMSNVVFFAMRDRTKDSRSNLDGFVYMISIQRDLNNEPLQVDVWRQDDKTVPIESLSESHRRLYDIAVERSKTIKKSALARLSSGEHVPDTEIEDAVESCDSLSPNAMLFMLEKLPEHIITKYFDKNDPAKTLHSKRAWARMESLKAFFGDDNGNPPTFPLSRANMSKLALEFKDDKNDEVRTFATKFIDDVDVLLAQMNDPDDQVRVMATYGLVRNAPQYLPRFMNDKSWYVRGTIADHIDQSYVSQMVNDPDRYVREMAFARMGTSHLAKHIDDKDPSIRVTVANNIDPSYLPRMIDDEDDDVLWRVISRIDKKYLPKMLKGHAMRYAYLM